jgi:hypothetical protein
VDEKKAAMALFLWTEDSTMRLLQAQALTSQRGLRTVSMRLRG